MVLKSKGVIILISGLATSFVATSIYNYITQNKLTEIEIIFGAMGILAILISIALIEIVEIENKFNKGLGKQNNKIESNSNKIDNLIEKFKRTEELNNIRINIKELQREVFKK